MYKRQTINRKDSSSKSIIDHDKQKRVKKHPIQQVISTLPQLAISFALLFFANASFESRSDAYGVLFYISLMAAICVCSIFCILHVKGTEYKNWQQDPVTRQYIQMASLSTVVSFFGFNISFWSIYGILTPVLIISGFTFALSILIIIVSFL